VPNVRRYTERSFPWEVETECTKNESWKLFADGSVSSDIRIPTEGIIAMLAAERSLLLSSQMSCIVLWQNRWAL
jgi:hypothetical protein